MRIFACLFVLGLFGLLKCNVQSRVKKWKLIGEVEKVLWNHFDPDMLLVSGHTYPSTVP